MEGNIKFEFYDPETENIWTVESSKDDLIVVKKGIHHKVLRACESNRLFVVSIPPYHAEDENPSEKI